MNVRRRLFGADRRLTTRILVTAALLAVGVKATVLLVAPERGFWTPLVSTYGQRTYVSWGTLVLLVCAPAVVAYLNDGWLPAVGVASFASLAARPTALSSDYLLTPPTLERVVLGAVVTAVGEGVVTGSVGYLLGVTVRYLVRARGRVGTPG